MIKAKTETMVAAAFSQFKENEARNGLFFCENA